MLFVLHSLLSLLSSSLLLLLLLLLLLSSQILRVAAQQPQLPSRGKFENSTLQFRLDPKTRLLLASVNGALFNVCDDGIDENTTRALCSLAGYNDKDAARPYKFSGNGNNQILLDEIKCPRNTTDFRRECTYEIGGDCAVESESLGLVCFGGENQSHVVGYELRIQPSTFLLQVRPKTAAAAPLNSDGTSSSSSATPPPWGTVCSSSQMDVAAEKVTSNALCGLIGGPGIVSLDDRLAIVPKNDDATGPIYFRDIVCPTPHVTNISVCSFSIQTGKCTRERDVGLRCGPVPTPAPPSSDKSGSSSSALAALWPLFIFAIGLLTMMSCYRTVKKRMQTRLGTRRTFGRSGDSASTGAAHDDDDDNNNPSAVLLIPRLETAASGMLLFGAAVVGTVVPSQDGGSTLGVIRPQSVAAPLPIVAASLPLPPHGYSPPYAQEAPSLLVERADINVDANAAATGGEAVVNPLLL